MFSCFLLLRIFQLDKLERWGRRKARGRRRAGARIQRSTGGARRAGRAGRARRPRRPRRAGRARRTRRAKRA